VIVNVYARHKCTSPDEHSVVVVITGTLYKPLTTGAEPLVINIRSPRIRSFLALTSIVKKVY
jgi:hypothetical protein